LELNLCLRRWSAGGALPEPLGGHGSLVGAQKRLAGSGKRQAKSSPSERRTGGPPVDFRPFDVRSAAATIKPRKACMHEFLAAAARFPLANEVLASGSRAISVLRNVSAVVARW
jgi:hypothetical protein